MQGYYIPVLNLFSAVPTCRKIRKVENIIEISSEYRVLKTESLFPKVSYKFLSEFRDECNNEELAAAVKS